MSTSHERRYRIGEVSKQTGVPIYLLRQWERKVTQLKPKRDRNGRRYYTDADINVVREINFQKEHNRTTLKGASLVLSKKIHGLGEVKNRQKIVEALDKIEDELRTMIHLLDSVS
ncbi:MAG TPA: MerR family transcriptional regulator [Candidatus Hydrogenedentes bacterium]|nr:MerR family transcriptional regulator [Candidatus Hydrogenedentota bacterium]